MKRIGNKKIKKLNKINSKSNETNQQIMDCLDKILAKIESEFNPIIEKYEKLNIFLKEPQLKKEYKSLISLLNSFKDNLKQHFLDLGQKIQKILLENNNNEKKNKNSEDINNEQMKNIEDELNNILNIQVTNQNKEINQIQNLEVKLHEYMNKVDELDFDKIDKLYDYYNKVGGDKIENIILKNDFIEQYNYKDLHFQKKDKDNNGKKGNEIENNEDEYQKLNIIQTLNHDSDIHNFNTAIKNDNSIINGIINMNEENKDNAIKYIHSLLEKKDK